MNGKSRPEGRPQSPAKVTSGSIDAPDRPFGAQRGDVVTVNLATLPVSHWRAYCAGYAEGYQHGVVRALDDIEAEEDRRWAELSARVRKQASSPRMSQLAARREEYDRAQRAREWERANGLGTVG